MKWKMAFDKRSFLLWIISIFISTAVFVAIDMHNVLLTGTDRGQIVGRDFAQSWGVSILLQEGRFNDFYHAETFKRSLVSIFGQDIGAHNFLYPPHGLLLILPLGYVPYLYSYVLWSCVTLGLYLLAVGLPDWSRSKLLYALLAPTTLLVINFGQTGLLGGALFIGGMRLVDRHPIYAGVLLGLLSFKPQLGLLIPFALLAGRLWIPFAAASSTVVVMAAWSLLAGGFGLWSTYLEQVILSSTLRWHELGSGFFVDMMFTPFMSARLLHLEASTGYAIQFVFAATALISVVWSFWRGGDRNIQIAILATATFLTSPYLLNYDMALMLGALILLFERLPRAGLESGAKLVFLSVWALPLVGMYLNAWGLPIGPVVLLALLILLLIEKKKASVTLAAPHD